MNCINSNNTEHDVSRHFNWNAQYYVITHFSFKYFCHKSKTFLHCKIDDKLGITLLKQILLKTILREMRLINKVLKDVTYAEA